MTQCVRALARMYTHTRVHTQTHIHLTHTHHRWRGEEEMMQLYTINPTLKKGISKIG